MADVNVHANRTYPKAGGVKIEHRIMAPHDGMDGYHVLHITATASADYVSLFLTEEQFLSVYDQLADKVTNFQLRQQLAEREALEAGKGEQPASTNADTERDADTEAKARAFGWVNADE